MADTDKLLVTEAHLALNEARRLKAERTKSLGSPIQLPGMALSIIVRGGDAWIAENTHVIRKINLESGRTLQLFRGHTGPVTSIAFMDKRYGSGDRKILISGSWDQTIKLWDVDSKELLSSIEAHSDFVKALLVFPSLQLLVSTGSDKIVRLWDLSKAASGSPLKCVGVISAHTRPVESLDGQALSSTSANLYTADTMGMIKLWELSKGDGDDGWHSSLKQELNYHRTKINEILYGNGQLWTASADETVQIKPTDQSPYLIAHPTTVRCILPLSTTDLAEPYVLTGAGDMIRVYDVSSPQEPELISEMDAHWHDVTALRLWVRKFVGDDGRQRVEPWIISASLDGTIRKWRLTELLKPMSSVNATSGNQEKEVEKPSEPENPFQMSEEEERELADLMDD